MLQLSGIVYFAYSQYTETTWQRMEEFSENIFQNATSEANTTLNSISQSISFLTFYSNEGEYSIVETLKKFAGSEESYSSYDIFKANQYCNSVFQNLMASNDSIHGIYLFTNHNIVFSCCNKQYSDMKTDYNPSKDRWYQNTLQLNGQFYISTYTSPGMFTDGQDSLYFARSINDVYTHKFLGVILVDCDPQILNLDHVNTMPDLTLLSISNNENDIVFYSNIDQIDKSFLNATRETKQTELAIEPLVLTASFNYDALFDEYSIAGSLVFAIVIVGLLGYLVLLYFITKSMIRPLETLSFAMSRQNQNHLAFSSPYLNRTDEIGTLFNEYSRMLEDLDASIKRDYKDKLILMDAQMKSLEAHINSHFLFNTLESINSMAELDEDEKIATMSLALGNMFRYSIKTKSELVTLADELQHVQDYVSIQLIRFSSRFSLIREIPQELYQKKVLKLILQPLVENALYHGLNYCTCGDRIILHSRCEGQMLYISVSDNGQGMPPETLEKLQQKLQEEASFTELGRRSKQSIGLKNIHSRIELYYGKGYGLTLESKEGIGTTITIRIPVLS